MMDNIDKDEIRRAIDRLQIEHHAHFTFDVTLFDNGTDFSVIQRAIDVVAKKCADDAEINIICEMAKLYLDGVKPVLKEPDRPHGEWIPCSERLPDKAEARYWVCTDGGYQCQCRWTNDVFGLGKGNTWAWKIFDIPQYEKVIAWMPLPEPYKKEGEVE